MTGVPTIAREAARIPEETALREAASRITGAVDHAGHSQALSGAAMGVRIADVISIDESLTDVDLAYATEVDWQQGYRLNPDSRLVLLGVKRILKRISGAGGDSNDGFDKSRAALVIGSSFGSLCSYEAFFESVKRKRVEPLTYTYAMPSTATAAASICFQLLGPTVTMSGEDEVGIAAVNNSVTMLAVGRCDLAIAGCWHVPSQTTRKEGLPERAQMLVLALQRAAAADNGLALLTWKAGADLPFPVTANRRSCVETLSDWIVANQQSFANAKFMPGSQP